MKNFTKQYWGAMLLVVIALIYLIPYYFAIQREKDPVIEIYFADRITAAHQVLIDRYNALNAGKVRVIPTDFPNDDFSTNERKEILARSLRGEGDGIDLFAVDVIWVARFAKWCEPLGNYFTQEELNKISTISLQACYSDSQLVAIPFVRDQGVLFYREDLLRTVPGGPAMIRRLNKGISWEEFTEFKRTLSDRYPFYIFPAAEYEGMICSFIENLLSVEPEYFSKHGFDFNTPEARRTLQLMVDLIHTDRLTPTIVTSFTEVPSFKYFIENDGLFIRGWTTYEKDFEPSPFDERKQSRLRKAPMPFMTGGRSASVLGGWDLMISKFSTKKEAVADFVKFLLREESQEIFYSRSGYYPVLNSFYEDSSYSKRYPDIHFIKTLLKSGVYRPSHQDYTKYSKIMSYFITLALKNRITVNEALERTTQAIRSDKSMTETY